LSRRQTIWVDSNRTLRAVDLDTLDQVDYYVKRNKRDIEYLLTQITFCQDAPLTVADLMENRELSIHIPRDIRQALFHRKRALFELADRRATLSRRRHRVRR